MNNVCYVRLEKCIYKMEMTLAEVHNEILSCVTTCAIELPYILFNVIHGHWKYCESGWPT